MDPSRFKMIAWLDSPEGERVGDVAKRKAWFAFSQKYPHADKSKFFAHVTYTIDHTATAEINYKTGDGHMINVLSSDSKYWMKKAWGMHGTPSGFPLQLTPIGSKGPSLPIPTVPFHYLAPSLKKIFNDDMKIYVMLDGYFKTRFREVFQKAKLPEIDQYNKWKEAKHWVMGPDMKYWPQQLNFATW